MIIAPIAKPMLSEDNEPERGLNKPIKMYKYRLTLDVWENEFSGKSDKRYCIELRTLFKDKKLIEEGLKINFEKLLQSFRED